MRRWHCTVAGILALFVLGIAGNTSIKANEEEEETSQITQRDCSFTQNPDAFLGAQARTENEVYERVRKFSGSRGAAAARLVNAAEISRRNAIDEEIFGRLERDRIPVAPLTTDEEFLRRIYLDLTGRVPALDQIREFAGDSSPDKRDRIIDRLLDSPEFVDRWTMWAGDWLGNTISLSTANVQRMVNGRNAFHAYIRNAISSRKSVRDIAWESVAASGATYDDYTGAVNFVIGGQAAMGPVQDSYDLMMFKSAATFLGMGHYDCLACHNGRNHLDESKGRISLWGGRTTRMEAWGMSAFFSRTRWTRNGQGQYVNPRYANVDVSDVTTGDYVLNTNFGNRPARCGNNTPLGANNRCMQTANLQPQYRDGRKPKDAYWRASFADYMTDDPMFAKNFVNRLWKHFFSLAFVEPMDTLDPARLDPKNPPPPDWGFQTPHVELLNRLAGEFVYNGYNLRETIRFIVRSNAYQLSSRYDGEWKIDYVSLYARHYPRRLEGEEIHDAITQATGVMGRYTWQAVDPQTVERGTTVPQTEPVTYAMQLPDPQEPRNNGAVAAFMNNFMRGNRDTAHRSQAGSTLQQLGLMNDRLVTTRMKVAASPVLRRFAAMTDNGQLVEDMFYTFLSRKPTEREKERANSHFQRAPSRNAAVEDLAWALVNKADFIFSY